MVSSPPRWTAPPRWTQGTVDELGTPLRGVTFVVVDLETTGGSARDDAITEIGAVKVRGGEVLGELATLVDPGRGLPAFITVLTGITETMLVGAPQVEEVLPAFLEFSTGCVLVAHNAPFDTGFLRAAAHRLGVGWPAFTVVDTARLARRILTRDEAPDCRLGTLARVLRAGTTPTHRALDDARATVDVLHALIERVGHLGVQSLEELQAFSTHVPEEVRRKRHLAEGLPHAPGVYLFRDGRGRALYVGTSRDLRARVRSYFTASEPRSRMQEMVRLSVQVDAVPCTTALEAEVRELRLIAEHSPPYNRRSTRPQRLTWLGLTSEPFPRLTATRVPRGDGPWLGPFSSTRSRDQARAALHEAFRIRQCGGRLALTRRSPACALAALGRCGAPCEGGETVADYAAHVDALRSALSGDPAPVVAAVLARVRRLADDGRYAEAAVHRDRLRAFARAAARCQRLAGLVRIRELVAARPADAGGWEVHVVRSGRLVGAGASAPGAHPRGLVEALLATAEPVVAAPGPAPAALPEETRCVLRWLESPGVRLVEASEPWSSPAGGAGGLGSWLAPLPEAGDPTRDRRGLRPGHRPAR